MDVISCILPVCTAAIILIGCMSQVSYAPRGWILQACGGLHFAYSPSVAETLDVRDGVKLW